MVWTDAAVVATKKVWDEGLDPEGVIDDRANYIQSHWDDDIASSSNYALYMDSVTSSRPVLNSPTDSTDAIYQARDWIINETSLFSNYDSIVVIDNRTYNDGVAGRGFVGTAGTNYGIGYVNGDGSNFIAGQEFGHNYNGTHADTKQDAQNGESTFEGTATQHSIMGNWGQWSCNVVQSYTYSGNWYSDCTKNAVRSYMDSNL